MVSADELRRVILDLNSLSGLPKYRMPKRPLYQAELYLSYLVKELRFAYKGSQLHRRFHAAYLDFFKVDDHDVILLDTQITIWLLTLLPVVWIILRLMSCICSTVCCRSRHVKED